MNKYIYKITNIINNKCYIGQTKDYKERFSEHKRLLKKNAHENQHLQNAWNKYGEENFVFEVLEYAENYNEREKYYILHYKSNDVDYGYNVLSGGDEPPVLQGENNCCSKLTQQQVDIIIAMLIDQATLDDIALQFPQITRGQIQRINTGQAWKRDGLKYPLKEPDSNIGTDIAKKIMTDLFNTTLTQKEIAKKYGVSRTCVTAINNGEVMCYRDDSVSYPIRNKDAKKINNSGVVGVVWRTDRNKWHASIRANQITYSLGNYLDKNDAIVARLNKEIEIFGRNEAPQRHLFAQYNV